MTVMYISCASKRYTSNGESIYKLGKNLSGTSLLDKNNSKITFVKSCKGCHGPSGTWVGGCNIQWRYLTDSSKIKVPYTQALFFRFLDEDLKSDGSIAKTGVHWQMNEQEKLDLIEYLKKLN
jgi:hypothetical protein